VGALAPPARKACIERGVKERLYFLRVPFPRIDDTAPGFVKPTRERAEISTGLSLSVIVGVLIVTVVASLVSVKFVAARAERQATESCGKGSKTDPAARD
jgi:hypothetical protein